MRRTRAAPWLWRAWVLLVGALGLNCRDAAGPYLSNGRLALMPVFESHAAGLIDFDRMRVTLVHPGGAAVLDTVITIPLSSDTIDVSLKVPLTSSSEEFLLYLRLVNAAGDTVLRNDPYPQSVTVTSGGGAAGTPVPVTVRATIASISVTPAGVAFSSLGEMQQLSAIGLDQNGVPLATQPTSFVWSSSAPAVASVNPATGLVTAVANGSATITATVLGVSGSQLVTVNQIATQFALTTPPSTAAAGIVIAPQITIAAQDARGNAVTGFTDLVTVAVGANPGGSILTGTTAKAAVGGVAQFADLRLDQPGTQYTLVFSTPTLPSITSSPFDVGAAPATVYWTNTSGGSWNTASNWSTGAVPGSADNAVISVAGTYTVTLDVDATFAGLTLGGSSGTQTLRVLSRTLTLNGTGTVSPNGSLDLNSSTLGGAGLLINKGAVQLYYSTIEAPLALRNELLITMRGFSYLNASVTTIAGSTLRIEGDAFYAGAFVTVASGFTNKGAVELTSINGTGTTAQLSVASGTLLNTGSIDVVAGSGGARTLDAILDNQGPMTVAQNLSMPRSGVHSNSSLITLAGGDLTINQQDNGSFTNAGSIEIGKSQIFRIPQGNVLNAVSGRIIGEGTFDVRTPARFTNDGELSPGKSPGILTVAGAPTLSTTSVIRIELGGLIAGTEYDQLAVSGATILDGTLDVTAIAGFKPGTYTVMTFLSSTGQFRTNNIPGVCNQTPIYTGTSVQIVCP